MLSPATCAWDRAGSGIRGAAVAGHHGAAGPQGDGLPPGAAPVQQPLAARREQCAAATTAAQRCVQVSDAKGERNMISVRLGRGVPVDTVARACIAGADAIAAAVFGRRSTGRTETSIDKHVTNWPTRVFSEVAVRLVLAARRGGDQCASTPPAQVVSDVAQKLAAAGAAALLTTGALSGSAALASEFDVLTSPTPKETFYYDDAGVLSRDTRGELNKRLRSLEVRTAHTTERCTKPKL